MYLATWHSTHVAVKVLTRSHNMLEVEQFRHGECSDTLARSSKQLKDAYYNALPEVGAENLSL